MSGVRPELRVFDLEEIRAALSRADAIEAVEAGFTALAEGRVTLPAPLGLHLPDVEGEVHVKGAHIHGAPTLAFKVATGFYRNPRRGLPVGSGAFLVLDAETGFPLALLRDDGWLTELRTGAAGALAARLLAVERPEGSVVAMVGAGVQARFQLRALMEVIRVAEVRAWSRDPDHARRYVEEMKEESGIPGKVAVDVEDAVHGADVVVTVTPSREPLVEASWVGPGATVIAVGSDGPGKGELAAELVARVDKIVVDRSEQSVRLGELQRPVHDGLLMPSDVHAELGEVVVGRRTGRESEEERIVCDLTGVGVQDAAIADAAWRRLREG